MVKNLPAMQETRVQSLGQEDSLEELIPVFLPGQFPRQRSLVGYILQGHKESDIIEQLTDTHTIHIYHDSRDNVGIESLGANHIIIIIFIGPLCSPFHIYISHEDHMKAWARPKF